jgi:hypothetical protein
MTQRLHYPGLDERSFCSLAWVSQQIIHIIWNKNMVDDTNSGMIVCDKDLEIALGCRALHFAELDDWICKQLVLTTDPDVNTSYPSPAPAGRLPRILPRAGSVHRAVSIMEREHLVDTSRHIEPEERFRVRQLFMAVLRTLDTVPAGKEIFTYKELSNHISQYVLKNKARFLDDRHIKVVFCDGDQLGMAFRVRTFHRKQVMSLLRSQLIPLSPQETMPPPSTPLLSRNVGMCTSKRKIMCNFV